MNTNSIRNNVRLGRNNNLPLKKGSGMMNLKKDSVNRVGGLPTLETLVIGKPIYNVPNVKSNNFKIGKGMMNKKQNDNKDKILKKKMNNLRFEL